MLRIEKGHPAGAELNGQTTAHDLGFGRVVELQTWETFSHDDWKVTLTPSKHWGARMIRDEHRGYGGYYIEHQGRHIYHAGDSAYSDCFKEIGRRLGLTRERVRQIELDSLKRLASLREMESVTL